jgi:cyanophycin synthetase
VPIIAITGTNGKTTTTRMVAAVYRAMRNFVGMTTTDGIYFDGRLAITGDCSGPRSAESVLQHPDVEVAVLETARGGILRSGLGWDRCQVAVVLNVSNDHLGLDGIHTVEDLADVKQVPVERILPGGCAVLNAEDPLVARMAEATREAVIYFGTNPRGRVLSRHLAAGGRAVFLRQGVIVLAEGARETPLLNAAEIPATLGGLIAFQVGNAMAAAAACWGAGCPLDAIRLGLRSFQPDEQTAPGRFNLFTIGATSVILDYGHNPQALRAIGSAVGAIRPRRAIGIIAAPGDRRDEDIRELARIAAGFFDEILVREDDDPRGRAPGETPAIIRDAVLDARPDLPVTIIPQEREAFEHALRTAGPGDLVVAFVDHVQDAIDQVRALGGSAGFAGPPAAPAPAAGPRRPVLLRPDTSRPAYEALPAMDAEAPDGMD